MSRYIVTALLLGGCTWAVPNATHPLITSTDLGVLRGRTNPSIFGSIKNFFHASDASSSRLWAGIPFAAPPLGVRRFRAPEPPVPWSPDTIYDATQYPAPCMQSFISLSKQPSEDCLYLNIHAPPIARTPPGRQLPVMVWIYGGAFYFGDSYANGVYNARGLVEEKDVIVVTLNYRIGAFGFFANNAQDPFSKDAVNATVDTNVAILDQRMALEWIQRNIHAFHGDPNRVTLFGMSAGATSIAVHMTSPTTPPRGLFHRVIHQSGPLGIRMRRMEDTVAASKHVAKRLGCLMRAGEENVQMNMTCMRTKPAKEILDASQPWMNDPEERFVHADPSGKHAMNNLVAHELGDMFRWWPTLDGVHIIGQPLEMIQRGQIATPGVDVMIGVQQDEGGYYAVDYDHPIIGRWRSKHVHNETTHAQHLVRLFGDDYDELAKYYPRHGDTEGNLLEVARLVGDFIFICPTQLAADALTTRMRSKKVYFYEWTQPGFPPYGHCAKMACHGNDIPYMFNTLWPAKMGARRRLKDKVAGYWTNFAATGNPNIPDTPTANATVKAEKKRRKEKHEVKLEPWTVYDATTRARIELGDRVGTMFGAMREPYCRLWNEKYGYGFDRS